jgi:hypothetical protein
LGARGQSVVEFALILPILLVLLLAIADFGRVFAAGVTVESAARAGAELAAVQYEHDIADGTWSGSTGDYARLHAIASKAVCDETRGLPNVSSCTSIPTVVCAHDGLDPLCGGVANWAVDGSGAELPISAGCSSVQPAARPSHTKTPGLETSRYVEVRICYRFSTLLGEIRLGNLSPPFGDFYLERERSFTVADY